MMHNKVLVNAMGFKVYHVVGSKFQGLHKIRVLSVYMGELCVKSWAKASVTCEARASCEILKGIMIESSLKFYH